METSSTITRRVAVFGLDGVTFDLLQPWLDEGRLPNLAALLAGGAHGRLRSTIPPVSASAWASFTTGTNPGQHGLVDFTYPVEDGYEIQITNGHTRAVPALWEIVSAAGGQVGVVSMPMTYPPQPLNGFMLCSFLTPSQESHYTYPPELQDEMTATLWTFPVAYVRKRPGAGSSIFVRAVKQMEIDRAAAVKHLLDDQAVGSLPVRRRNDRQPAARGVAPAGRHTPALRCGHGGNRLAGHSRLLRDCRPPVGRDARPRPRRRPGCDALRSWLRSFPQVLPHQQLARRQRLAAVQAHTGQPVEAPRVSTGHDAD